MDIQKHNLVPKHEIVSDSEIEPILTELGIRSKEDLPKILATDSVVKEIEAVPGDVLRITRNSTTRDEKTIAIAITYRVVAK
ncbi:MAG: DNA-directed RNA polymerase subunit H [archaeon]|nr:DNA-directed RNA polymerase subunit H [archaeon]